MGNEDSIKEEHEEEGEETSTQTTDNEIVVGVEIDNEIEPDPSTIKSRPRRANTGAGVERIQMECSGKGYGAKREFNFATNYNKTNNAQTDMSNDALSSATCLVIFAQMSSKDEQ